MKKATTFALATILLLSIHSEAARLHLSRNKKTSAGARSQTAAISAKAIYNAGTAHYVPAACPSAGQLKDSVPLKVRGRLDAESDFLEFNFKINGCPEEWKISYAEVTGLARGYVTKGSTTTLITEMGSAAGTVVAAFGNLNPWLRGIILGGSAAALIWYAVPKRNFITVFFDPEPASAKISRDQMKACAAKGIACFPQGEVAVFQIHSHGDYWDTSMVLDAKTGLAFESESAVSK
jgi:hypothetical protein